MGDIAALLTQSRQAHTAARRLEREGRDATEAWKAAQAPRLQAHDADPAHEDDSWLEDALHPEVQGEHERRYHRMPGRGPAEVALLRHADLLAYYAAKLGASSVLNVSSVGAAADLVQAPKDVAVEDTEAFQQLKREGR